MATAARVRNGHGEAIVGRVGIALGKDIGAARCAGFGAHYPLAFTTLTGSVDSLPGYIDGAIAGTANSANAVDASPTVISNPPTQAQVTSIRDKLNELIAALQRS